MFEAVKTAEHLATFDEIWMKVFVECDYELEEVLEHSEKYLIKQDGHYIGILEISPFYDLEGDVEKAFSFSKNDIVGNQLKNVAVCEKVAILKEHRGKGFLTDILHAIEHFYKTHPDKTYLVAFIEPKFCLALAMSYKVRFKRAGQTFEYKGDSVVPVVLNLKEAAEQIENHTWYNKELAAGLLG